MVDLGTCKSRGRDNKDNEKDVKRFSPHVLFISFE
jgi:hypothetical protein